jgi:ketosteroid isomerase-like protein
MNTEAFEADLRDLDERWLAAERTEDVDSLDALTDPDFLLVGPLGFTLDKHGWLERYRSGALHTRALGWDEVSLRVFGDMAIWVGRHTQTATYLDRPADGQFRATHVAARRDGRWLLVGVHLSTIATPLAAAIRAGSTAEEIA